MKHLLAFGFWLCLAAALLPHGWAASTSAPSVTSRPEILTLQDALRLAAANNLELKAARKVVDSLQGEVAQAGLIPNPGLEVGQTGTPMFGSRDGNRSVFVSEEIETGGKRSARLGVAGRLLQEAMWREKDLERNLRFQVSVQFDKTWVAQEQVRLLRKIMEDEKAFLALNVARMKLGAISGLEVNLLQADYQQGVQKLEEARRDEQADLTGLLRLLVLPLDKKIILKRENGDFQPVKSLEELDSEAMASRPDLAEAREAVERTQAQVSLAEADAWPDVNVGAGVEWDQAFFGPNDISPAGIISGISDKEEEAAVRVSIPLPIFNRNQGEVEKNQALRQAAILNEQNLERTIQSEVKISRQNLIADQGVNRSFVATLLPAEKKNLDTIRKAYALGGASILALLQAREAYLQSENDYLGNLFQLEHDVEALKKAIGEGLP